MSLDQVKTEIEREAGHQFDPQIGEKWLSPAPWATLVQAYEQAQIDHPFIPAKAMKVVSGNTGELVAVPAGKLVAR